MAQKNRLMLNLKKQKLANHTKSISKVLYHLLEDQFKHASSPRLKRWAAEYMVKEDCKNCNGSRLNKESRFFKIDGQNIAEIIQYEYSRITKMDK